MLPPVRANESETLLDPNKVQPVEFTLEELEAEILEAKKEILRRQSEKEENYRKRRLWYWRPSPKQLEFFKQADKKRRAGYCGNRFGKSTLGVIEDICWLIGYRPFFEEGDPLRTLGIPTHGVKGLVVAEDWDKVKEIFTNDDSIDRQGKFLEYLPEDFIKKTHRNEKGIIDQITVVSEVNGALRESIIYFDTVKSYKQAPQSFESSDWDFIHIDEPVMRELWTAVSRGLIDRGGFSWWLLTPLKEVWMYNEFLQNTVEFPKLYWWFEASMDDNPTLSLEDKELYLQQLPDDEREARKTGKPLAYSKLVFGYYDEDVHCVESVPGWGNPNKPPLENMVVYAIDTHPQTPHAVLFISISPLNDVDIYDEIYEKGTIKELCKIIHGKLEGTRVHYGLCEPAAWNEDQGSGGSYADIFGEEGFSLIPASKRKEDAIILTQQLFKQRIRVVRVHKRCKRLRKEIMNHYFDKDNKPEDKQDHVIECLRRLVIHDKLAYYPATMTDRPMQFTTERELHVKQEHLDLSFGKSLSLTNI
jgi:hypothetical protein